MSGNRNNSQDLKEVRPHLLYFCKPLILIDDSRRMTLREAACGKLLVTVIRAADLIASADGKSDPFCVVKIGENQESATPVINNDLNPVWNYTVSIDHFIISY